MRDYILNEQEIKEIIKTGKFLKEKYSNKLLVYGVAAEDLISNSGLEETEENIERAYKVILDDEVIDTIWEDLISKI